MTGITAGAEKPYFSDPSFSIAELDHDADVVPVYNRTGTLIEFRKGNEQYTSASAGAINQLFEDDSNTYEVGPGNVTTINSLNTQMYDDFAHPPGMTIIDSLSSAPGGIWKNKTDASITNTYRLYSRSSSTYVYAVPTKTRYGTNTTTNFTKINPLVTCNIPILADVWQPDGTSHSFTFAGHDSGIGVEPGTFVSQGVGNQTYTPNNPPIATDGWREFFGSIAVDQNLPPGTEPVEYATIQSGFPPCGTSAVYERIDSATKRTRIRLTWHAAGLLNKWKWLQGQETSFATTATIGWNPEPDTLITQISGTGLNAVTNVSVKCIDSDDATRFTQDAVITGSTWVANFAAQSPQPSDRYEITFTGGSNSGFRRVIFGGAAIISETAQMQPGSRLAQIDYSKKNDDGTDVVVGDFRDDLDLTYRFESYEDINVWQKLKGLHGQAITWNLGAGFENYKGFLRQFDIRRGRGHSELRLRIEGLA